MVIEDSVFIGSGVTIGKSVRIGRQSAIGMGSVGIRHIHRASSSPVTPCTVVRAL